MPYTDYNQVLQDLADNIREVNGTTDPIKFVDMPDLISGFIGPRIHLNGESGGDWHSRSYPWRRKLIPFIGNTAGMTDMSYMFYSLRYGDSPNPSDNNLKDLDLSHFDTSDVTNMQSMFRNGACRTLDLSSFDTSKVTNMQSMFSGFNVVFGLDLDSFDTSSVTDMSYMFNSYPLRKIWVPSTFVATGCSSEQKPFVVAGSQNCHVYTDASSAAEQDWGTIDPGFIMHYNSTHADYENA